MCSSGNETTNNRIPKSQKSDSATASDHGGTVTLNAIEVDRIGKY